MTNTSQIDALVRWQLKRGDPEPMRKRLKEQEKTHAVATYLANCELLEEFEDDEDR